MNDQINFDAEWEALDRGSPEERACFAAISVRCNDSYLTECNDGIVNRVRVAPYLSAYHLAEWFVWNWWRLRWEPRSLLPSSSWAFAHRMATVGHGYVWPNITIFSDGERTALVAKPSQDKRANSFRYLSNHAAVVASSTFENAIDEFVAQVRGQLHAEGLSSSNLETIWNALCEERASPELAKRRKLEALLGFDPDEANEATVEKLVGDAVRFGADAVNEIAADHLQNGDVTTSEEIRSIAATQGFDTRPQDAVKLSNLASLSRRQDSAAWYLGAEAARALRDQLRLSETQISNDNLSNMAGVEAGTLTSKTHSTGVSFALDDSPSRGRMVLRSKWETGRRFELARIIGDRVMSQAVGGLYPATRSYTYRQKAQRSFAAELLCPFSLIEGMLQEDYSLEARQDVADYFNVSEFTIRTSLMNHRRIEREDFDDAGLGERF
ncbi:MAG: hypothetical protein WDM86_02355 [Rhizomicrobium sp.]